MTELQTIEVRYEDADGRHVDVHEASWTSSNVLAALTGEKNIKEPVRVLSDDCSCCDSEVETHTYNPENVVKVEYTARDHEWGGSEETDWFGYLMFWILTSSVLFLFFVILWFLSTGDEIAL